MKKMKNYIRRTIALFVLAFTVMSCLPDMKMQKVEAANSLIDKYAAEYGVSPETLEKGLNICFNHIWYYSLNPDIAAVVGSDRDDLLEHFLSVGLSCELRSGSPVWDIKTYLAYNPDVADTFGDDYKAVFKQFIEVGIYETERITSPFYQGSLLKQLYSDLAPLDNGYDLAVWWLSYGVNEPQRISNPFGNVLTGWGDTFKPENAGARKYFRFPLDSYTRISSDYGMRIHPISREKKFHNGIDIVAPKGTPIHAADDGKVVEAAYSSTMGYYVKIDHGNGLSTIYMHASALYVHKGDEVKEGEVIAAVGKTGSATGYHLHFTVKLNGNYVSPWEYLEK